MPLAPVIETAPPAVDRSKPFIWMVFSALNVNDPVVVGIARLVWKMMSRFACN